jgi:hypothetical protein
MAIVPVSTSTAKRATENRSMANPPQAILDKKSRRKWLRPY